MTELTLPPYLPFYLPSCFPPSTPLSLFVKNPLAFGLISSSCLSCCTQVLRSVSGSSRGGWVGAR